jgi:ATP-dependent DNA helicase PIF1
MTLEVKPYEWQVHKRNAMGQMKVVASRKQIPLSIGHAFTCHRIQGITLDRVIVDCKGMFGEGQFYTAISRVKTKEGLVLRNFSPSCIKTNQACVEFYNRKSIDNEEFF